MGLFDWLRRKKPMPTTTNALLLCKIEPILSPGGLRTQMMDVASIIEVPDDPPYPIGGKDRYDYYLLIFEGVPRDPDVGYLWDHPEGWGPFRILHDVLASEDWRDGFDPTILLGIRKRGLRGAEYNKGKVKTWVAQRLGRDVETNFDLYFTASQRQPDSGILRIPWALAREVHVFNKATEQEERLGDLCEVDQVPDPNYTQPGIGAPGG